MEWLLPRKTTRRQCNAHAPYGRRLLRMYRNRTTSLNDTWSASHHPQMERGTGDFREAIAVASASDGREILIPQNIDQPAFSHPTEIFETGENLRKSIAKEIHELTAKI